jgi:hypothetical protein
LDIKKRKIKAFDNLIRMNKTKVAKKLMKVRRQKKCGKTQIEITGK